MPLSSLLGKLSAGTKAADNSDMAHYGKQLSKEQLSHLKSKGFEPAKNSIGASFVKSESGRYAKESDITKELEDFDMQQAEAAKADAASVSKGSAGASGIISVLKSIDGHLSNILDNLKAGQQKEAAAAEESKDESVDAEALKGKGDDSDKGGGKLKAKNPWQILIGFIGATLIPIIKTINAFYDEYLKPVVEKLSEVFDSYLKPFFTETLPKFFMEDIPEFFTKTLPELFLDGVASFKGKIEQLGNFFSGLVGKMKETLGEVIESIGDSRAVKFFLGDDNFLKKKGKELKKEGKAASEAAEKPKLKLKSSDDTKIAKDVTPGETVEYKGQKFIVPESQAALDNILRKVDKGEKVDSKGEIITPKGDGEKVNQAAGKESTQAVSGAPVSMGATSATASTPVATPVTSPSSSSAPSPSQGAGESSSSAASISPSIMAPQGGEMAGGGSGVGEEVSAATMAATEPEPVPGTPSYEKLRKKLSSKAAPATPTTDNTSIPSVFPNLGTLASLLYFTSDANVNPLFGGGIG